MDLKDCQKTWDKKILMKWTKRTNFGQNYGTVIEINKLYAPISAIQLVSKKRFVRQNHYRKVSIELLSVADTWDH
jgi:hypothetical protein